MAAGPKIRNRKQDKTRHHGLLEAVVGNLADGILVVDTSGGILFLNEATATLLGRPSAELLDLEFGFPVTSSEPAQICIVQPGGDERVVEMRASPTRWQDTDAFLVILSDVTRQLQISQRLRLIEKIFAQTAEGILISDHDNRIVEVNEAFTRITGYAPGEVIGKSPAMFRSEQHGSRFFRGIYEELEENGSWTGEMWNRRKNGELYPQWSTISVIKDEDGYITNYVMNLSDMTVLKDAEDKLWQLAHYDHLTGLPNHQLFYEMLNQLLRNAKRNGYKIAVLYIDLDDFRDVNEGLSQDVGDHVLKEIAGRITDCLRGNDILARVGGDEFVIAAGDGHEDQDATTVAMRVSRAIEQPIHYKGIEAFLNASIGIAFYPEDAGDGYTLVRNAHLATYEAKKLEGGSYYYFNQAMHAATEEKFTLITMMHKAVRNAEFEFHLQPLMMLTEQGLALSGGEALIRWRHPDMGWIQPDRFIPVAESTGLIKQITIWMLDQACMWLQGARDAVGGDLYISVNVTAQDIQREDFVDELADRLHRYAVPASQLQLEITERSFMEDSQIMRSRLQAIRNLGAGLIIDDFGTGYSSLSYMKNLSVDKLKIDKSFVQGLPNDLNDLAVCRAIAGMAHGLGLTVVAEGVEEKENEVMLRSLGCEEVQGFLYGKPVPAREFLDRYRHGTLLRGARQAEA